MKEVTYEDWQKNPTPRMMWVWDDDEKEKEKEKVVDVYSEEFYKYPVTVEVVEDRIFETYRHCAEIE